MAVIDKPVPAFLAKHGITSVRTNLQEGDEVTGFARELVRLFGKEFMAAWNAEKAAKAACSSPSQPAK